MQHLETTIEIQASPAQVWDVLLDFSKYSEWNPFIRNVEGEGAQGTRLRNTMHLSGQKPQVFTPKVLVNNPANEFRWLGRLLLPRIFDGEHYFKLTALPNGGTRLIHGEVFRGILVNPIMQKIGKATQEGFEAMNQALKDRLER